MVPFWRCTTRRRRAVSSPSVVLREMVSFDTTKTNSLGAWRGVGAWTASRFMASRALSWGARTNGAVCAAPGGSRHHLYHRLSFLRWEEARGEARAGREQLHRGAGAGRDRQGARAEGAVRSAARGSRRGHLPRLKSAAQAKPAWETSRKRSFIAHHSPPARPLHTRRAIPGTSTASQTSSRARRAMLGRARARTLPRQHETWPSLLSRRWWRRCRWTPIPLSVGSVPRRKAGDMPALDGSLSLSPPSPSPSLSLSRERASRAFSSRALSSSCSRFIATELVERLSVLTASS